MSNKRKIRPAMTTSSKPVGESFVTPTSFGAELVHQLGHDPMVVLTLGTLDVQTGAQATSQVGMDPDTVRELIRRLQQALPD